MGTLALLNTFLHKSITKIPNESLDFQVYTDKIGKGEISHHFTRVHSMDVMKSTNTLVIMQRTRIRVMDMAGPLFTHLLLLEMLQSVSIFLHIKKDKSSILKKVTPHL